MRDGIEDGHSVGPPRPPPVRLAVKDDEAGLFELLSDLPSTYPGAAAWLRRTWDEVLGGDAGCHVAIVADRVVAVAIEKYKPDCRRKLCTLFVDPAARRRGLGRSLCSAVVESWIAKDVRSGYITARRGRSPELRRLLAGCGFVHIATQLHRYGPGEDEDVFEWRRASHHPDVSPPTFRRSDLLRQEELRVPASRRRRAAR